MSNRKAQNTLFYMSRFLGNQTLEKLGVQVVHTAEMSLQLGC